ncbi:MAG: SpoIIIAH-like family protein, partial [Firmicutes bacterium]|nr:SpoIIIAH-like family protein [Bacillota bacterium]
LMASLEFMATSESFTAEHRAQAQAQKLELNQAILFEIAAEGQLSVMFQDVVVTKNGENINVLVRNPENITQEQATQIKTALEHIAGRDILDNIHIQVVA